MSRLAYLATHLAARATAAAGPASAAAVAAAALPPAVAATPAAARTYVKVPVRNNNLNKAMREVARILTADNIPAAWRRGAVFTRPAIARVEAAKAGVDRRARSEFKRSMRWVLGRRARGF